MKKLFFSFVAVVATGLLSATQAFSQTTPTVSYALSDDATGCECQSDTLCCDDMCESYGGGVVFDAELLLFKYYRADGVRAGSFNNVPPATTDDVSFDYEASPRLTLGYVGASGLGIRARYWDFNQQGTPDFPASGVSMAVDTLTLDLELFERLQFNDCWDIELSAGIRYNDFEETMADPVPPANRRNQFDGFGGVVGFEAVRSLGDWGGLYARARGALLGGDKQVSNIGAGVNQNVILRDTTQGMLELAMGWEGSRQLQSGALLRYRAGYEWQQWSNYSSSFTPITTAPGNAPASFAGPSDVGFQGFAFLVGFER